MVALPHLLKLQPSFRFSQNRQPLLNWFEPVDSKTMIPGLLPPVCYPIQHQLKQLSFQPSVALFPNGSTVPDVLTLAPLNPISPHGRAGINIVQPSPPLN